MLHKHNFVRKLLLLLSLVTAAQPAFAGDGTTPVIIFRNHAARTDEIVVTKLSNVHAPDDVYDFTPTGGDMVGSDYINNYPSAGYSYSPPPPPPTPPNLFGFKTQVMGDSTIPVPALVELSKFTGSLNDAVNQPAILQSLWAAIKQTETNSTPPGPLSGNCTGANSSVSIYAEVEADAAANNIPLTP